MPNIPDINKNSWSDAKKGCGSDKLIRDKWHISRHLKDFLKIRGYTTEGLVLARDLISKLDNYFDELVKHSEYDADNLQLVRDTGTNIRAGLVKYYNDWQEHYEGTEISAKDAKVLDAIDKIL